MEFERNESERKYIRKSVNPTDAVVKLKTMKESFQSILDAVKRIPTNAFKIDVLEDVIFKIFNMEYSPYKDFEVATF